MKKLFKNSFMALAVLALGFSACTEQAEYTPAEVPTTQQVFFPKSNKAQIDVAKEARSFDIAVSRIVTDGNAIVPVIVEADELAQTLYDFPATIEFTDSMSTAIYTVTVKDSVELDYAQYSNIAITISDEFSTAYGNATYKFKVGVPAPWTEWEVIGKATYNYGIFWAGGLTDATVSYSEYLLNDTDAKFDITYINEDEEQGPLGDWGMAGGYHFTIEYNKKTGECKVPLQVVYDYEGYGQVYVCDIPTFSDKYTYDEYPCTYDADKGKFTLNVIYFLSTQLGASLDYQFGAGEETIQLNGFKEYDYTFEMSHKGSYIDDKSVNNAVFAVTKGLDVSMFTMAVVGADVADDAIVNGMTAGTVSCDTLTESGYYAYPITESGEYKAVAVIYDEKKEAIDFKVVPFEFYLAGDTNPWESLGYASYTDDVVSTMFEAPNPTYKVEVRENKDKPGLYRIINPYGAAFPYNEEGDYDASQEYYIEIDATDPDAVYIPGVYDTGCNLGFGNFQVSSMAYYYMAEGKTKEEVKDAGLCGNLVDGVITFPVNALLVAMPEYENGAWLYANMLGLFMLDMSNMTATPDEPEASEAPAARMNVSRNLNNAKATGLKLGARCKRIGNLFLPF